MIRGLQRLKSKRGFTLVELIVVIAIIGVLAAILIPTLSGVIESARKRSVESTCHSVQNLAKTYATQYVGKIGMVYDTNDSSLLDMDDGEGPVTMKAYIEKQIPEIPVSDNKGATVVVINGMVEQVVYTEGSFTAAWNVEHNDIVSVKNASYAADFGKVSVIKDRLDLPDPE